MYPSFSSASIENLFLCITAEKVPDKYFGDDGVFHTSLFIANSAHHRFKVSQIKPKIPVILECFYRESVSMRHR
ncbi:hypothetical protein, partial [Vibrio inusitatus]|uniref:hypothetical protein n=1 Tax=Vibrio inusitatus TaxID=413402 RepID=UPI001ABFE576